MSAEIYRSFKTSADRNRHEQVVDPEYAQGADPDYGDSPQTSYDEGADPDYGDAGQRSYDGDYADPDSGDVGSQEYRKRSQK